MIIPFQTGRCWLFFIISICIVQLSWSTEYCRFGKEDHCTVQCHCKDNAACDPDTGKCPNGCDPGELGVPWTGPQCQIGNVAYKKMTSKGYITFGGKDGAVDGQEGSRSQCVRLATHQYVEKIWWYVDLQGLHTIYNISIVGSYESSNPLKNFEIRIGNTSATQDVLFTHTGLFEHSKTTTYTLDTPKVARFVRLQVYDNTSYVTFCEVIVYGHRYVDCKHCAGVCDNISGCSECKQGRLPQNCKRGTDSFGENGFFECHCPEGDTCDTTTGECSSGNCGNQVFPKDTKWSGDACQTGNIALGKMAQQKGAIVGKEGGKAVDGNVVDFAAWTWAWTPFYDGKTANWILDLGFSHRVFNVTVYNVNDDYSNRQTNLQILVGDNDYAWANTACGIISGTIPKGASAILQCNDHHGRYVIVGQKLYKQSMYLAEVVIIGHPYIDCSQCPTGVPCDEVRGCRACDPGKLLPDCKQNCPGGYHGDKCLMRCGQCEDFRCNSSDGKCKDGKCKQWYIDDFCDTFIDLPQLGGRGIETLSKTNETISLSWEPLQDVPNVAMDSYEYEITIRLGSRSKREVADGTNTLLYVVSHGNFSTENKYVIKDLSFNSKYSVKLTPFRVWAQGQTREEGGNSFTLDFKTKCNVPKSPDLTNASLSSGSTFHVSYQNLASLDHGCDKISATYLEYKIMFEEEAEAQTVSVPITSESFNLTLPQGASNRTYTVVLVVTNNEDLTSKSEELTLEVDAFIPSPIVGPGPGGIIGGVFGLIVLCAILIPIIIILVRRRKRNSNAPRENQNSDKKTKLEDYSYAFHNGGYSKETQDQNIKTQDSNKNIDEGLYAEVNETKTEDTPKPKKKQQQKSVNNNGAGEYVDVTAASAISTKVEAKKDPPKEKKEKQKKEVSKEKDKDEKPVKKIKESKPLIKDEPEEEEIDTEMPLAVDDDEKNIYGNEKLSDRPISAPVNLADLEKYIKDHKADQKFLFLKEYKSMPNGLTANCTVANKEENKLKNRFLNIRAYDHSRVVLQKHEGHSNYINASYVKDWKRREKRFIASQGPKNKTVSHFWQMIWQEEANRIVMVTNLYEAGKVKCARYWPEEIGQVSVFQYFRIKLVSQKDYSDFVIRKLSVTHQEITRIVHQFHYIGWPDKDVPDICTHILAMRKKVRSFDKTATGPLVVHCSAGIGRTGTFIGLDNMLDQAEEEGKVDIFQYTNIMREDRINMIQTIPQYVYAYDAILEAYKSGKTAIPVEIFSQTLERMEKDEANPIAEQYKKLSNITESYKSNAAKATKSRKDANKLLGETIDAVFLDGYQYKNAFILTQMPLKETTQDFWKFVADFKINTIVLLENTTDDEFPSYWPEDIDDVMQQGPLQIQLKKKESHSVIVREFSVSNESQTKPLTVNQYQFQGWHQEVPESAQDFVNLIEKVTGTRSTTDGPILVQCRNGAERSGLFCVACSLLDQMRIDEEFNPFEIIKVMRYSRHELVPSLEQYVFLHQFALAYLNDSQDASLYQNV